MTDGIDYFKQKRFDVALLKFADVLSMDPGNAEAKKLLSLIDNATKMLSSDREAGKKIPHCLWPREYVQKYGVTHLWKYNLDSYWRLIYTITGTEIEMFLICLDFMPHPKYDRKFGYG